MFFYYNRVQLFHSYYPLGFVDDLENSIDIVELVGRYTKLKKTGANYKAHCPFPGHSEKTPSFVVSPAKQIGYCFGCHKWGGPVKFIMDMENCEFRESMEILGQITGKEIKWFTQSKEEIQLKKSIYSLYKDATNYYKQALGKNPNIKKYLTDRGMTEHSISQFHFGYADSGIGLYNYLKRKWYDDNIIRTSQIFLDVGAKKDKFIGRIIFPIQNLRGDFVAFAGRITGPGEPKYLNSPASKIYDKSAILYGLYDAKSSILKNDSVIITEWYMDTIALHEAGFTNTVAVSGTALTEKHIQILKRLTHKIYLCFDGDKAGQNATISSLETLKNKGLEVKIITLPKGKDPDEIVKSGGDFQKLIDTSRTPVAFYISHSEINTESLDEKKKFLSEILWVIKSYSDEIERDSYIKEVSKVVDIPITLVYDELKKVKLKKQEVTRQEMLSYSQEDIAIAHMMSYPETIQEIQKSIIFTQNIGTHLSQYFQNPDWFLDSQEINKKTLYQSLCLKIEEQTLDEKDTQKIIDNLNREHYKKISKDLKVKMQSWDQDALEKYTLLLQTAKKHQIK